MVVVKKAVRAVKNTAFNAKIMLLAFMSALMTQLSFASNGSWNPGGQAYGKHSAGSDLNEVMGRGETLFQNGYKLTTVGAMAIGLFVVGVGLYLFYSSEEDQQKKKRTAWICLGVGGALSVIGFVMFTFSNTITGK